MNPPPPNAEVSAALQRLAQTPTLLICCDYDGTLAPIVENPDDARPHRESVVALRALAAFADTHVAVVSGRSLRDLAALSRLPAEIHLVGSHGSEFDAGFVRALDPEQVALRTRVSNELSELADADPGFGLENKPASVAFHYRNADSDAAATAIDAIRSGIATLPGIRVKEGKKVIELAVIETDKGTAIERLRRQVGADAVLFMGDDVTDEDGFAVLHGPDLGVKIGPGETAATLRIDDTEDASRALALLAELRRSWLEGAHSPPIEQHSMLSDHRTVALVTPDARVTWMCHPRADSPAVFAELVGGPKAGFFAVRPADDDGRPISQRYVDDTLVLETRWADLTVTDYLDAGNGRSRRPPGATDLLRVLEGTGAATIEFAPRLDYGRAPTQLDIQGDLVIVRGAQQQIHLHAPGVEWQVVEDGMNDLAVGRVDLADPVALRLALGEPEDLPVPDEPAVRAATVAHWHDWASGLTLPPLATDETLRSALTLKALCHQPTGAIFAAATTSLPEVAGGVRNWDYRYCWPRDASLTASALAELGSLDEGIALLGWILERVRHAAGPEQLRPLYAVAGDEFLPEAVLPTLNGYLGSRPVRIGNAADQQVQLDVFGPIVDLAHRLATKGHPVDDEMWELVVDMVVAVDRRWHEPDHGMWEERRPQRHHVHSKTMCWMAVDRAIAIAQLCGRTPTFDWDDLRQRIAADVTERGWNEEAQAYTIAYDDPGLDAGVLWLAISGLLPATDARFTATVKAIERDLRRRQIVYRYRLDDGLPGEEGGFLVCTAWLIEAYVLMDHRADARTLFERYLDLAGDTGLLSEEYDPVTDRMLGNHPQAYSHIGLINAALALSS